MRPTPGRRRAEAAEESDAALVARIARHERDALTQLFRRYHARLFRYLTRMLRSEAVGEELASEVFLEVWRGAGRFGGRSSVSSWLFGIAHHKAVSALRRRREDAWDEERIDRQAAPAADPEARAEDADTARALRACLERLSPEHREVLDLTYYQGLSVAEIAEAVGVPPGTVKTRMFHARRQLRAMLPAGLGGEAS